MPIKSCCLLTSTRECRPFLGAEMLHEVPDEITCRYVNKPEVAQTRVTLVPRLPFLYGLHTP